MSRLKCRAWDTKSKKWRDEIPLIEAWWDSDSWDDSEELAEDPYLPMDLGICFTPRLVWQQTTGLKDKNGVEIFEGDILQFRDYPPVEVKFGEYFGDRDDMHIGFFFSPENDGVYFSMFFRYRSDFTLIGNIFETPALLS